MSDPRPSEHTYQFIVGTTLDNRVLIDFRARPLDHLILTVEQAFDLAEALVDTGRQIVRDGRVIYTGGPLSSG